MACRFEIALSGEDARFVPAAKAALDEIDRIEARLTVFRETSALCGINRRASRQAVGADEDLFGLLQTCRTLHAQTEGAFDVSTTALSRCWGFLRREGRLPPLAEIEAARACVGMDAVLLDVEKQTVRFRRDGLELNLGGIGKGHALDRVARLLRSRGVEHALLSAAGSSVLALGGRSGDWEIDVGSRHLGRHLGRLRLKDGAVGTSGAGVQFVEVDGKRYGHVLDPRTGWPASGTRAATVITRSAAAADALSTAFLVGGVALAERYCAVHPDTLALVTPDNGETRVIGSYPGAAFTASKET
jgi:FAD:protein FMN transferase